jgi:hypothetical protein
MDRAGNGPGCGTGFDPARGRTGRVWLTYRRGVESLLRYWDSRRWRERPLPPADRRAQVTAIQTSADGTAIVTAAFLPGPDQAGTLRGTITHVLRWQNGAWHRLSLPTDVGAVAATSPGAMWAAGTTCVNPAVREVKLGLWQRHCTGGSRSWIRQWDGTAWRPDRFPPGISADLTFKEFTGQAPGVLLLTATPRGGDPVLLWYDGRRWNRATGDQDPNRTCREARSISPVPGTTALVAAGGGAGQAQSACITVAGPLGTG